MKNIVIIFFVLCVCSCNQKQLEIVIQELTSSAFMEEEYFFGKPKLMAVSDKLLMVEDSRTDSLFHLFDLQREQSILAFGVRGQAPNEFLFPISLYNDGDSSFCLFDGNKHDLYRLEYERGDTVTVRRVWHNTEQSHYAVMPVYGNQYITAGVYEDAQFYLKDSLDNIVDKYLLFPYRDEIEQGLSRIVLSLAYQGCLTTNATKDKFVKVSNGANMLSFYQIKDGKIELIRDVFYDYPDYKYQRGQTRYTGWSKNSMLGYLDVTANNERVYALYSGKSFAEHQNMAYYGSRVYVYSWDGSLDYAIELDKPATRIKLSADSRFLYAMVIAPEYTLVKYELNERIKD